ncbi:hypothetical protein [uncultured Helicobacter sp.]|uniref:hypothetical protein n=1 Tax=uncultured Helicobacter sp. TaxID=175537 RepID=UPI00261B9774|nr:hypothetical protein [uncultured Helicobacter sp.]
MTLEILTELKNTLIQQNNLLDASQSHKLELYAKEIELDSKKPSILSRDWIDKWILRFYRHTSDHHTDLLKIWHNLLILIGIFGFLSGALIIGFNRLAGNYIFSPHSLYAFYCLHIKHILLTSPLCAIIVFNLSLVLIFAGIFLAVMLYDVKTKKLKSFVVLLIFVLPMNCFHSLLFLLFAICLSFLHRTIAITFSYIITLMILVSSPKYIIPAIDIFIDKRAMFDPLSVVGAIYTILFGIMLYSLIKTARKNSIVPH